MRVAAPELEAQTLVDGMRISKEQLVERILELAAMLGFHTHSGGTGLRGFPDLVLVHPAKQLTIYAAIRSSVSPVGLTKWLEDLAAAGNVVHVWRPIDFYSGEIEKVLRGDS